MGIMTLPVVYPDVLVHWQHKNDLTRIHFCSPATVAWPACHRNGASEVVADDVILYRKRACP